MQKFGNFFLIHYKIKPVYKTPIFVRSMRGDWQVMSPLNIPFWCREADSSKPTSFLNPLCQIK